MALGSDSHLYQVPTFDPCLHPFHPGPTSTEVSRHPLTLLPRYENNDGTASGPLGHGINAKQYTNITRLVMGVEWPVMCPALLVDCVAC